MTDDTENLLDAKTNRSPAEVGHEVFRLARRHGAIRVELGDSEWDVKISPIEDEKE